MKKITIVITAFAVLLAGLFFGCAEKAVQEVVTTTTTTTTSTTSTSLVIVGNTYYVATNGNDSNPGTLSSPWKTIQHAADTMQAGDGVYIRSGTYYENVTTTASGAAGAYIIFSAYPNETPIIDGTNVSDNGFIITHDYIKLIGLEFRKWGSAGIWAIGAGHIEINNCKLHDLPYCIDFTQGTHDFTLENIEMYNFSGHGFDASPYGPDCYNGTIKDCVAHTTSDPAQNVDGFAIGHGNQYNFKFIRCKTYNVFDGFDLDGSNITAESCSVYNCNSGFKLWGGSIKLVNCLSYRNRTNLELDHETDTPVLTAILWNCTFMDSSGEAENIWVQSGAVDSMHMYNCIMAGGDNVGLRFEDGNISNYKGDYNIFHNDDAGRVIAVDSDYSLSNFAAWKTASGQDAHSFTVASPEAVFVSAASPFDLRLKTGSPAIDKGTSTSAPSTDFDGNPRPVGAGYDIGAYERQ